MSAAVTRTGANLWSIKFLKRTKKDKLIILNGVKIHYFTPLRGQKKVAVSHPMRKLSNCESCCSSRPARAFFKVPLRSSSLMTATVISGFLCLCHVCNIREIDKKATKTRGKTVPALNTCTIIPAELYPKPWIHWTSWAACRNWPNTVSLVCWPDNHPVNTGGSQNDSTIKKEVSH